MQKIAPCLWFDDNAEQAVNFYISLFKNSKIKSVAHYGEAGAEAAGRPKGSVMTIVFEPVKKLGNAAREQERPYGKAHARAHPRSGL